MEPEKEPNIKNQEGGQEQVIKTPFQKKIESAATAEELYETLISTLKKRGYDAKHLMGDIEQAFFYEEEASSSIDKSTRAGLERLRTEDIREKISGHMNMQEFEALVRKMEFLRQTEATAVAESYAAKKIEEINAKSREEKKRKEQEKEEAERLKRELAESDEEAGGHVINEESVQPTPKPPQEKKPWWKFWG